MLHKVVELIGEIIQCVNELDCFILLSTVRSVFFNSALCYYLEMMLV